MTAYTQLARMLRGTLFRRLFSVRLTSQLSDGVFQVALASYALFSDRHLSAAAIAAALAVVLLPFSLLGPFAGVLLDRWSRRQVLAGANLARVGAVALVAVTVALRAPDPVFYAAVLGCLSVNRFVLAALSAALPHTVAGEDLVTANALTPTAGTAAFVLGLGAGGLVRQVGRGWPLGGDVTVLLVAALGYAVAGTLALRIPRAALGPAPPTVLPSVGSTAGLTRGSAGAPGTGVRDVVAGLAAGLRHLRQRRVAATALATIASHRYWFGLWSVSVVLVYRDLYPGDPDAAFAGLGVVALVSGAGFLTAAAVTPAAARRWGTRQWALGLLVGAAVAVALPSLVLTPGPTRAAELTTAYALGVVSQGVKICVDTWVQQDVDDAYRGRVFSLYDMLFNAVFVAAAATAAVVLPADGRSTPVLAVAALGYLLTALLVARATPRLRCSAPVRGGRGRPSG